jgi:hypothetical protein
MSAIIDRLEFCKIMPFSKLNSLFLYKYLTEKRRGKIDTDEDNGIDPWISIFELMSILAAVAYGSFANKLQRTFSL